MKHKSHSELRRDFVDKKRALLHLDDPSDKKLRDLKEAHLKNVRSNANDEVIANSKIALTNEWDNFKFEQRWASLYREKLQEAFEDFLVPPKSDNFTKKESEKIEQIQDWIHQFRESEEKGRKAERKSDGEKRRREREKKNTQDNSKIDRSHGNPIYLLMAASLSLQLNLDLPVEVKLWLMDAFMKYSLNVKKALQSLIRLDCPMRILAIHRNK